MAQVTETFAAGNEEVTVALTVNLPAGGVGEVYEIEAETAPWSNQLDGSTSDQTAIIQAQIDAVPDGVPGAPNVIRFLVGLSQGKYFTQGDLANNPRGANGVLNFTGRHHLIIEGPPGDPATFYTVSPAVPWSSSIDLNQHSLRRHFWFRDCSDITIRDIRVEGSNYTFSKQLALGSPPFWGEKPDTGGTDDSRGYRGGWELEHAFAFDGCDQIDFQGECQDVWGDGLYLGKYGPIGTTNFVSSKSLLVGTGRQGVAMSFAADVLIENVQIGTEEIRPRRAAFDLEPVLGWVVERVEIRNFTLWMGNGVSFAALGRSRVDHINIHDGQIHGGQGSRCNAGAADGTYRADWQLRNIVWDTSFGSPQAAIRFKRTNGVTIDNCDVPVGATQSREAVEFTECGGELIVRNSRWGEALWVDYSNSSVPQLSDNTPGLTLRAV